MAQDVGHRLRQVRQRNSLSQRALAKRAGISTPAGIYCGPSNWRPLSGVTPSHFRSDPAGGWTDSTKASYSPVSQLLGRVRSPGPDIGSE